MIKYLTFFLLMPFLLHAETEVGLSAEVEVSRKNEYSLYDLVTFKQGSSEDLENMKKVIIPFLTKKAVLEAIKNNAVKTKIIFEDSFKVTTTTQVNRNELQRKVINHLTAECNTCIFEVQIQKLPFVNEATMNFRSSDFELSRGAFMLPLWDSSMKNKFFATGSWRTFKKVSVAGRWLAQGQRLTAEDLRDELKEITYLSNKLVGPHQMLGKMVSRAVPEGAMITRDILTVEKVVKKGDPVRLLVQEGPFEIEISAVAEKDGQEGDTIKVKTNQKSVMARVISKDKVVSE
jgi:flagellar basal body P-ring formation protein FlgA